MVGKHFFSKTIRRLNPIERPAEETVHTRGVHRIGLDVYNPTIDLMHNSKWPLSKFSRAMTTKTSIPRGHQAL